MSGEMAKGTKQLCSFFVDGQLFGVEVTRVQEVLRHQPMTPIPLAPAVVEGLINLRGQIVTALDMRQLLDLRERPTGELPMNVVVHRDDSTVSLLVDEIGDVVDVDDDSFEPAPETLAPGLRAFIRGVYKLAPQLLLLLDTDAVLRFDARQRGQS